MEWIALNGILEMLPPEEIVGFWLPLSSAFSRSLYRSLRLTAVRKLSAASLSIPSPMLKATDPFRDRSTLKLLSPLFIRDVPPHSLKAYLSPFASS